MDPNNLPTTDPTATKESEMKYKAIQRIDDVWTEVFLVVPAHWVAPDIEAHVFETLEQAQAWVGKINAYDDDREVLIRATLLTPGSVDPSNLEEMHGAANLLYLHMGEGIFEDASTELWTAAPQIEVEK